MTAYNTSPYPVGPTPVLMVGGRTEWLYGNLSDTVSTTQMSITSVSLTSNVATIVGTIISGNAPVVGSPITVQGTQTSSGRFNGSGILIASVTTNALTGVTTVTYPLTNANIATTADAGFVYVPAPMTYETLVAGSSKQAASAENDPSTDDERSYFAQVFFGTLPTAVTVTLQASLVDQDSAYQTVGTVATVVGSTVTQSATTFSNMNYKFVRFNVSGLTGTGTIAAAILG